MKLDIQLCWSSSGGTDVGLVRSRNEDAFLAQPERGLWAVADGMGGHAFGDVASRAVVDALATLDGAATLSALVEAARARLQRVNLELRADAQARRVPMMGSTVVLLLAQGAEAACLWAGDSRIYLYRDGQLRQLTQDHSHAETNMITRAVGAAESLDLDVNTVIARDGDIFLLCSDGLSNPVADQAIQDTLASGDCVHAAQALIAQARANGGRDNITAVVVRADAADSDKTMLNPAL
jgi:protein phosphatase